MPLAAKTGIWKGIEAILDTTQKIKKGHRVLILLGTLFLLGGSFYALFYMPYSEEIYQLKEDISGLKHRIALAKIKAKNLARFRAEHARVEKQFEEALKILPDKREIPSLLKSITQLGINSKLQFRLFKPGRESPQDFYVKIPVSIEVRGTYREVALFFDKVRRMNRIVNIENISMKPKTPLSTDLVTKCTAITYRFKTKAEAEKDKKAKKK